MRIDFMHPKAKKECKTSKATKPQVQVIVCILLLHTSTSFDTLSRNCCQWHACIHLATKLYSVNLRHAVIWYGDRLVLELVQ